MEKYQYICHYCGKEYVPRRRHVQRFCCTSCRVNAFNQRAKITATQSEKGLLVPHKEVRNEQKISLAGVGNAVIANAVTDLAKRTFTPEESKPATKGDLRALLNNSQQKHLPIINIPRRSDGATAFYDTTTKEVIYLNQSLKWQ